MSWQNVLSQLGHDPAITDSSHLLQGKAPGYRYPLTQFSCLAVEGPDRFSFLQGQVTCDMNRVEQGETLLGAHLNLQGRIEVAFILFAVDEQIIMLLPDNQVAHLKSLLQKYLLFANAELRDAPEWLGCLHWSDQPHEHTPTFTLGQNSTLKITLSTAEAALSLLQDQPPCRGEDAEAVMARHGLYLVDEPHHGAYLPQELNFDLIDGISFNKGCYKGQEVVARLHFKGQVKQRLTPFHCFSPSASGTAIFNADGKKCGEIVQQSPMEGGSIGCALIRVADWESKNLFLEQNDGPELQLLALPYAIT